MIGVLVVTFIGGLTHRPELELQFLPLAEISIVVAVTVPVGVLLLLLHCRFTPKWVDGQWPNWESKVGGVYVRHFVHLFSIAIVVRGTGILMSAAWAGNRSLWLGMFYLLVGCECLLTAVVFERIVERCDRKGQRRKDEEVGTL